MGVRFVDHKFDCKQTELDDTKSYDQLIIKNTIPEKRIIKLRKKGKFTLKNRQRRRKHSKATAPPTGAVIRRQKHESKCMCTHAWTRNFECDRLT